MGPEGKIVEPRVLVVDDEDDVRLGLGMLARSAGASVQAAASGEEALEIASAWRPHLVLSDITMGGMSGLDLLDALRKELPSTRVVLITGFGTIELAVTAMHRGATHFLTKPFDNEEILGAVRRFGAAGVADEQVSRMREADSATLRHLLPLETRGAVQKSRETAGEHGVGVTLNQ